MTNETDRARRREIVLRGIEEMSPAAG
jgi:hypothetical protein